MMSDRTATMGVYSFLALAAISASSFRTGSPALARKVRPSRISGSLVADATALRFSADAAWSTDSRKGGKLGMFIGNCIIVHAGTVIRCRLRHAHKICDITGIDTAAWQTCIRTFAARNQPVLCRMGVHLRFFGSAEFIPQERPHRRDAPAIYSAGWLTTDRSCGINSAL